MESTGELFRLLALAAAAATALAVFSGRTRGRDVARFAVALAIGALACHLGGGWLHEGAPALPQPGAQTSLLFLPVGLLATLPHAGRACAYLDAAAPALAFGIASARLGCIAAGCCMPWIAAGAEILGWLSIAFAGLRAPRRAAASLAIGGGALRFGLMPLRDGSPAPAREVALALVWLLVGLFLARRSPRPTGPAEVALVR